MAEAILARQNEAAVRHGDETTWRVQSLREESRSSRAWLWTSVSEDAVYFHIDPSRGAEVARKLFGTAGLHTVIVCDRYSAYKKMARIPGGLGISHHPLGGWIIGCELECFFLSVAFAVEPGPVGGWS